MAQQTNNKNTLKESWIVEGLDEEAIVFAENFAQEIVKGEMTKSQFRNFYGEVKRIQFAALESNHQSFLMLKPKLAYATKRSNKPGPKRFFEEMTKALDSVNALAKGDEKRTEKMHARFQNFCDLLEAILAYHKFHGGKN